MASLAIVIAESKAVLVAGSIVEQACFGGLMRFPAASLAWQLSVDGAAEPTTTSTFRTLGKSAWPACAVALPAADVTLTAPGLLVSSDFTLSARAEATVAVSSALENPKSF